MNPMLLTDFYKTGHLFQYPKGTEYVYSNLTPRKSRMSGVDEMVVFGIQVFIQKYLIEYFNEFFFKQRADKVMEDYKRIIKACLGTDLPSYQHIYDLWNLGYLPVRIKALPEGSMVPMRCPFLTIINTNPGFFWVTNFLETLMSAQLWQPCTSATIAYQYRKLMNHWAEKTGLSQDFVQWQGHDFSFRGMSSLESAMLSGMGHLLSFTGTDTIPSILGMEEFYGVKADEYLIGGSVAATEHSVMCAGGDQNEFETLKRLITEVYPTGVVSVVSDTWNLWTVLTDYLPRLKDEILARDGKVVIRPDSGDPVDIICGTKTYLNSGSPEGCGIVELLDQTFGHTLTPKGYKLLDGHVGVIYGDSISLDRAERICNRLSYGKNYASQCVFGIGSYSYQYNTRDTFGLALKATHVVINGKSKDIYKTPVTDDGTKNSAKGLIQVWKSPTGFKFRDQVSPQEENLGALQVVFEDGIVYNTDTLPNISKRLWG